MLHALCNHRAPQYLQQKFARILIHSNVLRHAHAHEECGMARNAQQQLQLFVSQRAMACRCSSCVCVEGGVYAQGDGRRARQAHGKRDIAAAAVHNGARGEFENELLDMTNDVDAATHCSHLGNRGQSQSFPRERRDDCTGGA